MHGKYFTTKSYVFTVNIFAVYQLNTICNFLFSEQTLFVEDETGYKSWIRKNIKNNLKNGDVDEYDNNKWDVKYNFTM